MVVVDVDSGDSEHAPTSPPYLHLLQAKKAEHARKLKEKETRQALLEGDKLFRIQRVGVRKSK